MMKQIYILLLSLIMTTVVVGQEAKPELTPQQQNLFQLFFSEGLKNRLRGDLQKSVEMYVNCLKIDNSSSAVAYELSKILSGSSDFENANKFIDMALANDDTNNKFYIEHAIDIKIVLKKYNEALPLVEKLIALDKNNIESHVLAYKICVEMKNYDKALYYLDQIPKDEIKDDYVLTSKYDILMKKGEKRKAYKLIKERYKKNEKNAKSNFLMADYSFRTDKSVEGLGYLKIATDCEGGDIYNFDMASLMIEMKKMAQFRYYSMKGFSSPNLDFRTKYEKLVASLSNKQMFPRDEESQNFYTSVFDTLMVQYAGEEQLYMLYVNYCTSCNDIDKAVRLYEELYSYGGMSDEAWKDFLSKLSGQNNHEKLEKYASVAYEKYSEDPMISLIYGESLVINEKYVQSIEPLRNSYSKISVIDNPQINSLKLAVMSDLAQAYYYTDSVNECFAFYDEILKMDQYNAGVLNNYSYYLSLRGEKLDKAEEMARKANEIEPRNATFLDTYAWVLYVKGNYSEALFIMERAIDCMDSNRDNGEIYDHYGDILYKNGYVEKAVENWEKAYNSKKTEELKKKINDRRM